MGNCCIQSASSSQNEFRYLAKYSRVEKSRTRNRGKMATRKTRTDKINLLLLFQTKSNKMSSNALMNISVKTGSIYLESAIDMHSLQYHFNLLSIVTAFSFKIYKLTNHYSLSCFELKHGWKWMFLPRRVRQQSKLGALLKNPEFFSNTEFWNSGLSWLE